LEYIGFNFLMVRKEKALLDTGFFRSYDLLNFGSLSCHEGRNIPEPLLVFVLVVWGDADACAVEV
jgi:hypothetical protein